MDVAWECAGCCGRFGHVAANCPCPKSACTRCGGAHPTHQCKETKVVRLGEKEIVALLCQTYDAMINSWSLRAQKLLIELSSCGKAKMREALVGLVSNQFEGTVLPLLQQVKETQKQKKTQKHKQWKATRPGKADELSEMQDVPPMLPQPVDGKETQFGGHKRPTNLDTHCVPAASHQPATPTAASVKQRPRGCKRGRNPGDHSPSQMQVTDFMSQPTQSQTPSSAESTPVAPLAMTPAQGRSGNRMTRMVAEGRLRKD